MKAFPAIKKDTVIVFFVCTILVINLIGAFFTIQSGTIARWTYLLTILVYIMTIKREIRIYYNSVEVIIINASQLLIYVGVLFIGIKLTSYQLVNYYTFGYSITAVWPYLAFPLFVLLLLRIHRYNAIVQMQEYLGRIAFITFLIAMSKSYIVSGISGLRIHSAFYACIAMISLGYCLPKLFQKRKLIARSILIVAILILILFPVLGALRSASILTAIILFHYVFQLHNKRLKMAFTVIILFSIVYILTELEQTRLLEGESQTLYTPSEMLQSYSISDPNANVRLEFWNEGLSEFYKSPIWGTLLGFQFDFFGRVGNASVLHNYYIGMLADGGLLLIVPTLIIVLTPILHNMTRKNRANNNTYIAWLVATIGTIFTNCNGHGPLESTVIFIYMAFAIIGLSCRNDGCRQLQTKNEQLETNKVEEFNESTKL